MTDQFLHAHLRRPYVATLLLRSSVLFLVLFTVGCAARYVAESTQDVPLSATPATAVEFSLDAELISPLPTGTAPLYLVEYRGYPNYRILRLAADATEFEVIFQVPKGALIYGIGSTADKKQLLLAYAETVTGLANGIYTLDLETPTAEPVALLPRVEGITYSDIVPASDNTFWVTVFDMATNDGQYSIAQYDFSGALLQSIPNATAPILTEEGIYFLPLEADYSRRSIARLNSDSSIEIFEILSGEYDLNNAVFIGNEVYVSVLSRDNPTTSSAFSALFRNTVSAHGNHNTPATWVVFDRADFSYLRDADWDAKGLYDSFASQSGQIVEVTTAGLELISADRTLIVKSRAFRFATH